LRGGGRSSARETASRVVGGAIAKQLISGISINAFVSSVGDIFIDKPYQDLDFTKIENNLVRCPDEATAAKMETKIREIRKEGDTIGGTITCVLQNVPIGLGEPVFDKLHADLGKAMLSINAVKGFEIGSGFCGAKMKGSEHNDLFNPDGSTKSNLSGGIQGGISNGMDIYFRVAFKPVATIMQDQTQKPLPISKPFTAFIDNIAFPKSACNLSKTGSPSPIGTFCKTQVIVPPIVSPSFLISLILVSILAAVASSGQRTKLFSIFVKSKSW
jgi:chorismate synthase